MGRKKGTPVNRGNLDIDPEVAPVANASAAEAFVVIVSSSSDCSSSSESSSSASSEERPVRPRAFKRTRKPSGAAAARPSAAPSGAAAARPAAVSRIPAAVIQIDDTSSDEPVSASVIKQIWSFANLSFEHEDFVVLQKHFDPSMFCIAFVVIDVHDHLLPAISVDADGYCSGISCKYGIGSNVYRPNSKFVLSGTNATFPQLSLEFYSRDCELSPHVIMCLNYGLASLQHGIWCSLSSRFIFPLVLELHALAHEQVGAARKHLRRMLSEYRPQQFSAAEEENCRPLPVEQILEFICRRPDEHVEPAADGVTPLIIPGISTSLKGYQREAVAWARCMEAGTVPALNTQDLVALPVQCSVTQREVSFDPVQFLVAGPMSDSASFRVSGGMLCDEMGLGKTLECLALVMLTRNLRPRNPIMPSVEHLAPQSKSLKPDSHYRCICGQNDICNTDAVQCENCLYWLHVKCIESFDKDLPYFCLSCRSHVRSPLESDCTLIISPSSISGQVGTQTQNSTHPSINPAYNLYSLLTFFL